MANNPLTVDNSTPPRSLMLANLPAPVVPDGVRNLALIEEESSLVCVKESCGKVQYIDLLGVMFDPMDPNNARLWPVACLST